MHLTVTKRKPRKSQRCPPFRRI